MMGDLLVDQLDIFFLSRVVAYAQICISIHTSIFLLAGLFPEDVGYNLRFI